MRLQEQIAKVKKSEGKLLHQKTADFVMNIPDTSDENDETWIDYWKEVYANDGNADSSECANFFCKAKMLNQLGIKPRHKPKEIVGAHVYIVNEDGNIDTSNRYIIPLCKACNHASNNGVVMFLLGTDSNKLAKLDD